MAARKGNAPTPSTPSRDDVLADTLRKMGNAPTLAEAGRIVGVAETRLKSFRQNIRDAGTFKSRGGTWDDTVAAHVYAERPFIRRAVDAYVDGIVGADAPASE